MNRKRFLCYGNHGFGSSQHRFLTIGRLITLWLFHVAKRKISIFKFGKTIIFIISFYGGHFPTTQTTQRVIPRNAEMPIAHLWSPHHALLDLPRVAAKACAKVVGTGHLSSLGSRSKLLITIVTTCYNRWAHWMGWGSNQGHSPMGWPFYGVG